MSFQVCRFSELLGFFTAYKFFQEPNLDDFIGKLCELYDPELGYVWLRKIMLLISDGEVTIEKNDGFFIKKYLPRKYLKMNYNGKCYAICMDNQVVWDVELGVAEGDDDDLFAALCCEANEEPKKEEPKPEEPDDIGPDDIIRVKKIQYKGIKYLREKMNGGRVFDYSEYLSEGKQVVIGTWNDDLNKIIFN
jgi:hypothetical protein